MLQPITSSRDRPRYRGPLSSNTFNRFVDDVFYDLHGLYQQVYDGKAELERAVRYLQTEITALRGHIDSLQLGNQLAVQAREMTVQYPNSAQDAADSTPRAYIDKTHNVVTLPLKGTPVPRAYNYDIFNRRAFVAPDTKVLVGGGQAPFVEGDDPLYLVDPEKRFWRYCLSYPAGTAPAAEEISVQVSLSSSFLSDYRVNLITFYPHPLYTLWVTDLGCALRSGWQQVPGFVPLEKITPVCWCFPVIEATNFNISLRQSFAQTENNRDVFVFGGRYFNIFYQEYEDAGVVLSCFEIMPLTTVVRVKHYFANAGCLSQLSVDGYERPTSFFTFELYKEESDGTLTYLADWRSIPANKVWVRTVLKKDQNGTTPALSKVALEIKQV
ncbi:MAG: hypothetical protein AB1330_01140 [Bacillota bacterium]